MGAGTQTRGCSAVQPASARNRKGLVVLGVGACWFAAVLAARLSGAINDAESTAATGSPAERSAAWLTANDYSVIVQVAGDKGVTLNAEATRRGDLIRAAIQTVSGPGGRQVGYERFRWESSEDPTEGQPGLTAEELDLLADLASPGSVVTRMSGSEALAYAGEAGEAVVYRQRDGSAIFVVDDRPARLVIKRADGITETWQFTALDRSS